MTSEKNKCTVLCFAGRWPQTNAHAFDKIKGQVSWPGEDVGGWKKVETVLRNRQSHGARSNGREAEIMGLSGQVCPLAQIVDERNRGTKSWQGARKKMRRHLLKPGSGGWRKLQIL
ncbi:MAG: hypothetical protein HDR50_11015 [Desulfovibrio sp.]|uniref:hypothetical protein n=1 Tax=Desulfovibrio sp. TaxID=885 RepID=UPI001A7840AB|nr:hypothetical protein [Desulfovibrio sp.]MBD5418148.1 hypothetical protein [Desulfovibrio sp.]